MKHLKYLLIIFILFLTPKAFALEYNMNSKTSATLNGTKNRYLGTEIYNTGTANTYTFGTRYSGKLSAIDAYFDYPFEKGTTYTLTYNMNTEDFRNTFGGTYWWDCSDTMNASNQHVGSFTYVSYKKVKFSFTPSENTTCIRVLLGSTSLSSTAITGVSNWRLDSITLYDPDYQSGSSGGQGSTSTPTPTPNNNQDIINNQNNNTQDIINNSNQNTSDIIENNNENTNKITDTLKDNLSNCLYNYFNINLISSYSTSTGSISKDNNNVVVVTTTSNRNDVVYNKTLSFLAPELKVGENYTLSYYKNGAGSYIYLLGSNRVWTNNNSLTITQADLDSTVVFYTSTQPATGYYENIMIQKSDNKSSSYISYGEHCKSKLDETNAYLTDDSDPSISDNDFLTMFNSIGVNDPLSYLLTLPTQLINKIVSLSDTCTSINLGTLYGVMLTMPCINLENILGSTVWTIIDVIFSVSLLVVIFKNLYDTFSNLLTMGAEKEAKEKFSMPTPMDFLSMILGGDR